MSASRQSFHNLPLLCMNYSKIWSSARRQAPSCQPDFLKGFSERKGGRGAGGGRGGDRKEAERKSWGESCTRCKNFFFKSFKMEMIKSHKRKEKNFDQPRGKKSFVKLYILPFFFYSFNLAHGTISMYASGLHK